MTTWMRIQTDEERMHAMKFLDFINERGGRVVLKQIDQPKIEWSNPLDAFQDAYNHECMISGRINDLANLAGAEGDHAATTFLQWFVTEQVEEEATALGIVEKLKMIGDNPVGILMMDQQLGQRTAAAADGQE
jgi:ferritin